MRTWWTKWRNMMRTWWNMMWKLHPYAQVLAMFAFNSYSQSKRWPRPLSRHRPCKTPFPIGNASFNKPWPNYHGSIMFHSFLIESHRNAGFQRAFFRGHCWRPQTKSRSRPFSYCRMGSDKGKKRGPKRGQNEVRKKPRIYTHGLWPASRKPALPWITGSETMTICRIPAHRHGSVEMIIPALCRSTRKQQQQQPSNQQPQQQQDASSCRTQQQPSQRQWERNKQD